MELDKQTIKSISSDTRIGILKSLARRRKMPAELSKQLGLAPSTVAEHLKILESSKLIKRSETGHKWIYYELSEKGKALVSPQHNPQFVIVLVLGSLLILGGLAGHLTPYWHPEPIPQFGFLEDGGIQADLKSDNVQIESGAIGSNEDTVLKNDVRQNITESVNVVLQENSQRNKNSTEDVSPEKTENKNDALYAILVLAGLVFVTLTFFAPRKYILEVT